MDVKYVPADWEKMKSGIGNLIGSGVYGKVMIDDLKDISSNLEDAESAVAKYDSDGVISFKHTDKAKTYQNLFEDFKALHRFTGKVGDIVDRTIDQPFYEDIDAFVAEVQQLSISNYKTKNRIDVTNIVHLPGSYESMEVLKTEVGLDDLFSGDSFYAEQMKLEYEAWKQLNTDQDISKEDYQLAILNMRAFGYESIQNQQENKEFWASIAAVVVIVGVALVCPPAGIALGVAYGTAELTSAVTGKDWVSGRELGTGERWFRGVLAPLDIIPGAVAVKRFSGVARTTHMGSNLGELGFKTTIKTNAETSIQHLNDLVATAAKQAPTRLKNANAVIKERVKEIPDQLAKQAIGAGRILDETVTNTKILLNELNLVRAPAYADGVSTQAINTHFFENEMTDMVKWFKGLNIGGTGAAKEADIPPAFKQKEFASSYEARLKQTPAETNSNVVFEGVRGESLCTLKPPPDPTLQKILNEAGVNGIGYKNGVPDFSPVAKAQIEVDYMLGGKGAKGNAARGYNFEQANERLAEQLNNSPELAHQFSMKSGNITARDIEKYRVKNKLTWHEVNDGVTMQLVPTEINAKFGHLGGVGEINSGAFKPGGFANK
jgi:hypothetical protein